jgi:CheY-like chemotaxis protein
MAHLLLAEENAITALVLRIRLLRAGHTITLVEHGDLVATAVEIDRPDLILLEAWLPDPDGLAVAQQLKADLATRAIPIVMCTALADPQWLGTLCACGVDAVWTTPTDHAALMQIIATLMPPTSARLVADRDQHIRSSA